MVDIEWQFRQQVAAQQLLQAQQALQVQMQQQQLQQLQSHLLPPGPAPMPLYPAPQPVHAQGQMQNFGQPSLGLPLGADSAESVRTFFLFTMLILFIHFDSFFSSLSLFLHYFFNITHAPVRISNNILQVAMQYSRINETYERILALQGQLAGIGGIGGGGGRTNL